MTFAELSRPVQILRLWADALMILEQYPIKVARVRCISHSFNTIFRVDTTNGLKFALRINVNSRRPVPALKAEIAWLEALRKDTDLVVPQTIPRRDGGLISSFFSNSLGRDTVAVLFSWLSGQDLGLNGIFARCCVLVAAFKGCDFCKITVMKSAQPLGILYKPRLVWQ